MKVWVLNLDAEFELASPGPYQTPDRVAKALEPWAQKARVLLAPEDQLIETWSADPARAADAIGACWCPTPSALRRLSRAGVRLPPSPSLTVLQRVNDRRFYLGLGGGAPGAIYVEQPEQLEAALAARSGAPWLFKKPFGFAGRGQRRIGREVTADDRRWLSDGLRQGGLLAEPWLELEREVCLHGNIDASGAVQLGQACLQRTDAQRAWVSSTRAGPDDLTPAQRSALTSSAERVAEALIRAGYFGPFGIDAYLWRNAAGNLELNPLSEVNARFTMGFSLGMRAAEAS
jgi:ATP-grasp domain